jgi:hypothetical protein
MRDCAAFLLPPDRSAYCFAYCPFFFFRAGWANDVSSQPVSLVAGRWHHVAASWSPVHGRRFYFDGALVGRRIFTSPSEPQVQRSDPFSIGRTFAGLNEGLGGCMAEVGLWSTELSAPEVYALARRYAPPPAAAANSCRDAQQWQQLQPLPVAMRILPFLPPVVDVEDVIQRAVAFYELSDPVGTSVVHSRSGSPANVGRTSVGVTFGVPGRTAHASACHMRAADGFITVAAQIGFPFGASDYTLACWVRLQRHDPCGFIGFGRRTDRAANAFRLADGGTRLWNYCQWKKGRRG